MNFMNRKCATVIIFVGSLLASQSQAGNGSSGGGAGVICQDSRVGPTHVVMLEYFDAKRAGLGPQGEWQDDLFDRGPHRDRLTVRSDTDPKRTFPLHLSFTPEVTLDHLLWGLLPYPKLEREIRAEIAKNLSPSSWKGRQIWKWMPERALMNDVELAEPLPAGCRLVQVAWREDGKFYYSVHFNSLSTTQEIILMLHEAVYAIAARRTDLSSAAPVRQFFATLYEADMTFAQDPRYEYLQRRLGEQAREVFGEEYARIP